ncbi:inositol polyphosphate-5-phosphatase A isoform X2 [Teleopsis dalmanni]|uniref:inositol polyphosphate-5-phosphatase A isoform X2 n=1 Tax=Teleopsis dalmanni TaxID=139649 RepID=UPI0018CD3676|nr:inositol polyphosphate-5-phosphatase A isoform X2 [Teleopsis dalmanni]
MQKEKSSMCTEFQKLLDEKYCPSILLVTANVGSIFEDSPRLLHLWLDEFLQKIEELQPKFLALHLQEVGGKTYEKSSNHVKEFIDYLCGAKVMTEFIYMRIYMDENYNSVENFTALGNLYFVHKNLENIKIWNFSNNNWEYGREKYIYTGNIETVSTKEKSKFPQHFFPECKWSRKGFMRTRWEIEGTVIDFVNIHLFHDASNLAACEQFPSVYCSSRRRALIYTLKRFHLDDKNLLAPYFVFGDFNFRCDTQGVIKELANNLTVHRIQNNKKENSKIVYRNSEGDNVLTIGKKEFNYLQHQVIFKESWMKKYDRELETLKDILIEFPIKFPPSYPYEEDPDKPSNYMSTRCPAWCDRILMSPEAKHLIMEDLNSSYLYDIVGRNVCMGDHKPIYLKIRLKTNQGIYRCCKCCIYVAKKSTSHYIPAVSTGIKSETNTFCP